MSRRMAFHCLFLCMQSLPIVQTHQPRQPRGRQKYPVITHFPFDHIIKKLHSKARCRTHVCVYHVLQNAPVYITFQKGYHYIMYHTHLCHVKKIIANSPSRWKKIVPNFPKRNRQHIWTLNFLPKLKIIKYTISLLHPIK